VPFALSSATKWDATTVMIFGACPEAPIANSCAALRLRVRPNMRFVPIKNVEACLKLCRAATHAAVFR
jgi:hypothetical protein